MTSATLLTPATSAGPDGRRAGLAARADERSYVRLLVVLDTTILIVAC